MNQPTRTSLDNITPTLEPVELLMVLLAVAGGTLAAAFILPMWLPGLTDSLLGSQPKAYWYLARASGFIAYLLLFVSTALGLIITNKMARLWNGGPTAVDLHQFTTWLAVALTLFHAFILLGDRFIQSTPSQVLVPFGYINYKPEWVGIGQIAFYLMVVVASSFYLRKHISYKNWRRLHYASFLVFVLITLHGVLAGTDASSLMIVYAATGLGVYFLTIYRIVQTIKVAPPAGEARHVPARPAPNAAGAAAARPAAGAAARPAGAAPAAHPATGAATTPRPAVARPTPAPRPAPSAPAAPANAVPTEE